MKFSGPSASALRLMEMSEETVIKLEEPGQFQRFSRNVSVSRFWAKKILVLVVWVSEPPHQNQNRRLDPVLHFLTVVWTCYSDNTHTHTRTHAHTPVARWICCSDLMGMLVEPVIKVHLISVKLPSCSTSCWEPFMFGNPLGFSVVASTAWLSCWSSVSCSVSEFSCFSACWNVLLCRRPESVWTGDWDKSDTIKVRPPDGSSCFGSPWWFSLFWFLLVVPPGGRLGAVRRKPRFGHQLVRLSDWFSCWAADSLAAPPSETRLETP